MNLTINLTDLIIGTITGSVIWNLTRRAIRHRHQRRHPATRDVCTFFDRAYQTDAWLDGDLIGAPTHCTHITVYTEHGQTICTGHFDWLVDHLTTARRLGLDIA